VLWWFQLGEGLFMVLELRTFVESTCPEVEAEVGFLKIEVRSQ
jgi:hypothetical protein